MAVDAGSEVAPPGAVRGALRDTWASLRSVFVNPALRRIELALAGSMIGDWAYATAIVVWAYGEGGAKLVGIWGAVRLMFMAFAAPIGSTLADRLPRKLVLIGSDLTRSVLVTVAAVLIAVGAPSLSILVVATLSALVGCVFRPAQMAWMPSLARTPEELTAANGASSTIESLAFFAGPAIGALLISVTNVQTVLILNVLTFLLSAALVSGIRGVLPTVDGDGGRDGDQPGQVPAEKVGILREMGCGFTFVWRDRDLLMVAVLTCAQTIVAGATIVLGVVFAVDVLGTEPEGVGIIDSAFGVGAIVGGFFAIARSTRNKLAGDLAFGTALWSLPLLLVVAWPSPVTVFAAVILLGFGNPLVDVNFATIVQRLTPDHILGRVFGAYEGALIATMALGSAVTPFLLDRIDLRWTLTVLALLVGVPALAFLPRCLRLDATLSAPEGTDLLRGITIFSPLSPAKIEALARALTTETAAAGSAVVSEGEVSDRFLVIVSGRVEVTQAGEHIRYEGPGEFFGEIGLLRDVPRTATVTAVEDTSLYSLSREDFLDAVRGVDESLAAADDVVMRRLARA
jgi:predicted MFS family arabinose efflux permease